MQPQHVLPLSYAPLAVGGGVQEMPCVYEPGAPPDKCAYGPQSYVQPGGLWGPIVEPGEGEEPGEGGEPGEGEEPGEGGEPGTGVPLGGTGVLSGGGVPLFCVIKYPPIEELTQIQ